MPITQAICSSFKKELFEGVHDFSNDAFKIALYDRTNASLSAATTAYMPGGEVAGAGYIAGGNALTVTAGYPALAGATAELRFDDVSWLSATFMAGGALIYNATKANRAVCVLDFGANRSVTNGTFTVQFPAHIAATLRLL